MPDAGTPSPEPAVDAGSPFELVETGVVEVSQLARPAFGVMTVARHGSVVFAVESRRVVEPGPFGIPWRSQFRLAASEGGVERWAWTAEKDDLISDVAAHPSGEVTIALQLHAPARDAYELLRFGADGALLLRAPLPAPQTIPAGDFAANDPRPLFRMKGQHADAFTGAWVRLAPLGEGVVTAYLSYVDVPPTDPRTVRRAIGVSALGFEGGAWVERWSRVVEGGHGADPAAWAYDEFRWREQAVRPFLAVDEQVGDVLVGRAWNSSRCAINREVFAEVTAADCVLRSVGVIENERLPLAVTRFSGAGQRLGTVVLTPPADAPEWLAFSLAARDGKLAIAGAVVRALPDGTKRSYPEAGSFVDYDGFISVYAADGQLTLSRDFNFGRGDVLAALRWSGSGLVAAGSSGWDRWHGGMSVSRGSEPSFVFLGNGGDVATSRLVSIGNQSRHWSLHDVQLEDGALVGYGVSDAPMTHSADGQQTAERTFGPLRVVLRRP
jgi:hypothetical protein